MKATKVAGITIILMLVVSMLPMVVTDVRGQSSEELEIYKAILSRALELPDLPSDLREKIGEILKSEPKTAEEALKLIDIAKSVLKEVEKVVEKRSEIGKVVEQKKLTLVITVLIDIAKDVNATSLVNVLSEALDVANKGDVKRAREILSKVIRNVEAIKVQMCSEAMEKSVVITFEHVSTGKAAVNAIIRAISNINMTIEVLKAVKEKLLQTNASETAINALERVVDTLNSTTEILESVIEIVQTAGVEEKVGNITQTVAINRIIGDVKELKDDINELLNKTIILEQQLNMTLSDVRDILSEASALLNKTESLALTGDVGEAVRALAHAKSLVKSAEKILEKYEKLLEEQLRKEGELREYVIDKLVELNETYQELLSEAEDLYERAVSINATNVLNVLRNANETLSEVLEIINEIEVKVEQTSYEEALALINKAEEKIKAIEKLLSKAEDLLNTVLETVKEILNKIDDLREELDELKDEVEELLSSDVLNKTLEKIDELQRCLDEAEALAKSGNVKEAGKIIKEVKELIKQLENCIDKVSELLDEIEDLKDRIEELREEYQDNEYVQKILDEAEKLLDKAVSALEEAIEKISMKPLKEARDAIKRVEGILREIEEEHIVKFEVVDSEGNIVPRATIVFDGEDYHTGQATRKVIGTYDLEVGEIPDEYTFDHWESKGDVTIESVTSPSTKATVEGDCKIILVLKKSLPEEKKYTITFYVRDTEGNPVANANIVFDGEVFYDENTTEKPAGEYVLKVGYIPEGYSFEHWKGDGKIIIKKPKDSETSVIIKGNASITMVLKKEIEEKVCIIVFHIIDEDGIPVTNASIIFDGKEYFNGDIARKYVGEYSLAVGNIPEGYEFSYWKAKDQIEIEDEKSESTTVSVEGDGEIFLILKKVAQENFTIIFYIVDVNGDVVLNATIVFDNEEYSSGESTQKPAGEYHLSVGSIPENYQFKHWKSEGKIKIIDSDEPETKVEITGDGVITLILEKKVGVEEYTIVFYIKDVDGNEISNATIVFDDEEYSNGDSVQKPAGNYSLSIGEIPEDYQFKRWETEGKVMIVNPHDTETTAVIEGNGSIILILEKIHETENYTITFYIRDSEGNELSNATIIFDDEEYSSGDLTQKPAGEYHLCIGEIPEDYQFKYWRAEGMIVITDLNDPETTAIVEGNGSIILVLERKPEAEKYVITFYIEDVDGNEIENATLIFNGTEYSSGTSLQVSKGTYLLSVGVIPSSYKFKRWDSEGDVTILNPLSENTKVIIEGDGSIVLVLEREVTEKATIEFYVEDIDGNIIWSASIKFNGKEYFSGQNITIDPGEYEVEPGIIPHGYKFKCWEAEGKITIEDTSSQETGVTVSGDGKIILILEKTSEEESASITAKYTAQAIQDTFISRKDLETSIEQDTNIDTNCSKNILFNPTNMRTTFY